MNIFNKILIYLECIFSLFACNQSDKTPLDYALLTGKLSNVTTNTDQMKDSVLFTLSISNPITNTTLEYETKVNKNGTFSFKVPVVCPVYASIISTGYHGTILLEPNKETSLDLFRDEVGQIQMRMIQGEQLTEKDLLDLSEKSMSVYKIMESQVNNTLPDTINIAPNDYRDAAIIRMEKDLEILKNDTGLPEKLKQSIYNNLSFFYLQTIFDYESNMQLCYLTEYKNKNQEIKDFTPIKPDKSYYSFLKHFELNNPPYLMLDFYSNALQTILSYEALAIPHIGDTPVDQWIGEAKIILKDLVGFDTGIFYDLLAANSYSSQILNDLKPLSQKQKDNINTYFTNKAIIDILLKEDDKIKEIAVLRTNSVPNVPHEELMDAILSEYKGKLVLVDFWATWCTPCLQAIASSKEMKEHLKEKEVVFVYIAGVSSPSNLWKSKVLEIEGEHYYLNSEEWNYLLKKFDFSGIPAYLLYDTNGILKEKITGYPGTEKMQQMIEELLS